MSSKGKILVVDDDRLVLATLTHGLSAAGYAVVDADNGDDAILEARTRRPDLALLDIRMEGKSGFDVAAYLREHGSVPFMFLSAFSDAATVAQVRALGALDHLIKPVDMRQILPAVEAAFKRIRGGAEPAAEVGAPRPRDPLSDPVAIAVGVVMHRHSLPRAVALERLRRLATHHGRALEAECEQLLAAVELLSAPAAP
ncbi:response regulator [Methylibium petroleiphilum]|uniref:response regulator n=1 Tax=Methylibium petroleiphilum TaxID=105560 RepID=UPI001AC506A3|nr:response regulator [Methylibium petroleiphilum]MBN9204881.1 response regulator [Methylibium petroleiphilum]